MEPRTLETPDADEQSPLLSDDRSHSFADRWTRVQARFVDDPRNAVEEADELVQEVMQELTATFSTERERLEQRWSRGDEASTEDLRVALQRYRSFFQRLLST